MLKKPCNKTNKAPNGRITAPFEAFESRIRKVLCELSKQDIVIEFNPEQLKMLYNKVLSVVETSIFAEMEQIMNAIQNSLQVVIAMKGGSESLNSMISHKENFKRITTHVVANYQSLGEQRINILMTHNPKYQDMEDELFGKKFITEYGFEKAFDIHQQMIQAFHNRYHELLFEGVVLDKDSKIETSVIEPVIQRYEKEIQVDDEFE
ncbi:hypothetical protein KQI49_09070 [Virgibacillus sp. MSJ-26]|uniref:hypothetical protein n=1 Tax=Virgibacillus sp. MSJ-26 TaxID=2841522 RepID=UPI001C119584|nr:hypothetical protein [Virgibacillus sp. MSJ-26]MBU5466971.1 hypothetical protein [Virgibacillus sp. MSJ-26]